VFTARYETMFKNIPVNFRLLRVPDPRCIRIPQAISKTPLHGPVYGSSLSMVEPHHRLFIDRVSTAAVT
jgi:hypothetical protein